MTYIDLRTPPSDPLAHEGEHIGEPWRREPSEADKLRLDLFLYGRAFSKDGRRIDPGQVFVEETTDG